MKILCLNHFEEYAEKNMDHQTWSFYSQGAEREFTLKENQDCFTRYTLIPRMLRNTSKRDLTTTVLGERVSMPIGIAPMAHQRLAHPDGEIAASIAASNAGIIYTLSTLSNTSIEDVSTHRPNDTPLFMQLYVFKDRTGTRRIIERAETCGYKALVLTVDTPVVGLQLRLWRDDFKPPPHLRAPNVDFALNINNVSGEYPYKHDLVEDRLTWKDVAWIKSLTKLPLVLKGILTVEDAQEAVKHGASAVWISNHGGRQLDGVHTALDVLPEIASALAGTGCDVFVDGGVRWGTDVLKALALGANAVFVGRPILYALNHSGQNGVSSALEILRNELDKAMHLAGCNSIRDIGPHLVQKRQFAKI
ncbi:hydroxyacid oxidase 1 [Caerostris darwini]|uniref:(S)-2-hydroxy-acid oxidase n=1 Tax=Caerostris darwini TaxID=1538125 RepID=A0AAV4UCH7_9ARAC|nr:hydroxyacid oxidase 1 [Caerostris darwini]